MWNSELLFKARAVGLWTVLAFFGAWVPISSQAVQIYDQFPAVINAAERYVIYSHGLIAEGDDPRPVSPRDRKSVV